MATHEVAGMTPDQVRQEFRRAGVPLSRWARERGWKPSDVYMVMGGKLKGDYGRAHDIAVALGLKGQPAPPRQSKEHRQDSPFAADNNYTNALRWLRGFEADIGFRLSRTRRREVLARLHAVNKFMLACAWEDMQDRCCSWEAIYDGLLMELFGIGGQDQDRVRKAQLAFGGQQ